MNAGEVIIFKRTLKMTGAWLSELKEKLAPKKAGLITKYENAFSLSYQEDNSPDVAVKDIHNIEKLSETFNLYLVFYKDESNALHIRLFQYNTPIPLSDLLPVFENMDLRT